MASLENWPQLQALCLPGQEQPQCGHQQITIFLSKCYRIFTNLYNLPYVTAVGPVKLNLTLYSLDCYNCCLYMCLNADVPIDLFLIHFFS